MKIITLFFVLFFITSFKENDEVFIRYPRKAGVVQTCKGQEADLLIEITTESEKEIKVHSFSLDKTDFTIIKKNKEFAKTDTFQLSMKSPLIFKVRFKIPTLDNPNFFSFKTNIDKYSDNQIKLSFGQYLISTNDIRERREHIIDVLGSCQDSIKVFFPYGGTVSSATLYNDSSQTKKELKSISYHIGGDRNCLTFSKEDIGHYYVDFGSCYWGGGFWLTIK